MQSCLPKDCTAKFFKANVIKLSDHAYNSNQTNLNDLRLIWKYKCCKNVVQMCYLKTKYILLRGPNELNDFNDFPYEFGA